MKIYFLTYGDNKFKTAKKHLVNLAKMSDYYDEIISLSPKDLSPTFKIKFKEILSKKRGGGYWIWKHHIILSTLKEIKNNDLLVYCDAGASLNFSESAKKRHSEYIQLIRESEWGLLRMECEKHFIEKRYTSKEILKYFEIDWNSHIATSTQLQAGHMILKKNEHALGFLDKFEKILEYDPLLITDFYNKNQNIGFVENRHDQSIFSILSKKYGSEIIENETEFKNRPEDQYSYPYECKGLWTWSKRHI